MAALLPAGDLPDGFDYPPEFIRLVELGLLNLEPWRVLTSDALIERFNGLRERYPSRSLVPFASRQDNDDVACWDPSQGVQVLIVHDFASPGWELQETLPDFIAWLRAALDVFLEWMP